MNRRSWSTPLVLGAIAVALLTGCGGDSPASPYGDVVACGDLLRNGWTAPETEPSINYDPESGVAEVAFTEPSDTLVINLRDDADCSRLPDIGPILERTPQNHRLSTT